MSRLPLVVSKNEKDKLSWCLAKCNPGLNLLVTNIRLYMGEGWLVGPIDHDLLCRSRSHNHLSIAFQHISCSTAVSLYILSMIMKPTYSLCVCLCLCMCMCVCVCVCVWVSVNAYWLEGKTFQKISIFLNKFLFSKVSP